jgi:phi LC3 family holin
MKINWKVRIKNKVFWATLISALALLAQAVAAIFGYKIDLTQLSGKIIAAVNALFGVLSIIGLVNDPTTEGLGDSQRAMGYDEPWNDEKKNAA